MRLDHPRPLQPDSSMMEGLEERLCLSTTRHHFYTGVRPHFTVTTTEVHHSRHHFHTGVRARFTTTTTTTNPPAVFGQITTTQSNAGNPGNVGLGTGAGAGTGSGLFGGGTGGLFGGGGGSIFATTGSMMM